MRQRRDDFGERMWRGSAPASERRRARRSARNVAGRRDARNRSISAWSCSRSAAASASPVGIERVAEDRVAERQHVDAQLMRAAGERGELHAGDAGLARRAPPSRSALARPRSWSTRWRGLFSQSVASGRSTRPLSPVDVAPDAGDVVFLDLAVLELAAERAERLLVEGEQQQPRGVLVEPVHDLGRPDTAGSAPAPAPRGNRRATGPCPAR